MKFTSKEWIRVGVERTELGSLIDLTNRCRMYTDLVNNHLKKGMSQAEVKQMLGETRRVIYCIDKRVKCLSYYMGNCYGDSLTQVYDDLDVCFDARLKVIGFGKDRYNVKKFCNGKKIDCLNNDCGCYTSEESSEKKCPFEVEQW